MSISINLFFVSRHNEINRFIIKKKQEKEGEYKELFILFTFYDSIGKKIFYSL
jgi:hypothetical protein